MDKNTVLEKIKWLGHDCIMVDSIGSNYPVIYFDPYQINSTVEAGIILITHEHYDHCSIEDVKKIIGQNTIIVTEKDSAKLLRKELGKTVEKNIEVVSPGQSITVSIKGAFDYEPITIEAVPSYNLNKKFHPKNKNWLGFIVDIGGVKVYHAGDTDYIPEMSNIRCDIALLPVSGTYVMTAEEAISAALDIKPQIAIPMHYGSLVGDDKDAEAFRKGLEGKFDVRVMKKQT